MLFQKKTHRITVAVVSDTHIGSTLALCPPNIKLDDGQQVSISTPQRWLLDCWNDFWAKAQDLGNKDIYTFLLGDMLDNLHHNTSQLWSYNEADWMKAAATLLKKPKELSKHIFCIRGTTAHTKQGGSLDEEIALMLNAELHNDNSSSWKRKVYVGDVLFDLAHKGPVGRLPWTTGNALNRLSHEVLIACVRKKTPIPNVILRSHNHIYATSGQDCLIRAISAPAWQLCTEYGYNLNPDRRADIGGLLFECWEDQYVFHPVLYQPEEDEPWKE